MLRINVKAGKITHLTDARYFAAMGVTWMSIDLDALAEPIQDFKEIIDWVEGPIIVPESENYTAEQWEAFIALFDISLVQTDQELSTDRICSESKWMSKSSDYFIQNIENYEELTKLSELDHREQIILDVSKLDLNLLTEDMITPFGGIQILGSAEEKIGFKSYDDLDVLFDSFEAE